MSAPLANYSPFVITGNLMYISGQLSRTSDGAVRTGVVGADLDLEAARELAQLAGQNLLTVARTRPVEIVKVVRLHVQMRCAPTFDKLSAVADGASNLMIAALGSEVGSHSRTVAGVVQNPLGAAVMVDGILEISSTGGKI